VVGGVAPESALSANAAEVSVLIGFFWSAMVLSFR
jgi:hypothetical protein